MVLYELSKSNGLPQIRIVDRYMAGEEWMVPLNSILLLQNANHGTTTDVKAHPQLDMVAAAITVSPIGNLWYHSPSFRFALESPVQMKRVFQYNVRSRQWQELTKTNIPKSPTAASTTSGIISPDLASTGTTLTEGNAASLHTVEQQRVLVASHDGALVPLTLIRKRNSEGNKKNSQNSNSNVTAMMTDGRKGKKDDDDCEDDNHSTKICTVTSVILTAYGSYGACLDLSYNPTWQPLLQRGVVLAFAHVRGGGELGQQWHAHGKKEHKPNAVHDFIACAQAIRTYLFSGNDDYCEDSRRRMVQITAKAFSAGGVVVASALNRRPDLFDAAILTNAFLDVHETLKCQELHLSQQDWEEFGNPHHDKDRAIIESYCPVASLTSAVRQDHGHDGDGPRILLISALDDALVPFRHSLVYGNKWRTLRILNHDNNRSKEHQRGFYRRHASDVSFHFEPVGGHQLEGGDIRTRVAAIEAVFALTFTN